MRLFEASDNDRYKGKSSGLTLMTVDLASSPLYNGDKGRSEMKFEGDGWHCTVRTTMIPTQRYFNKDDFIDDQKAVSSSTRKRNFLSLLLILVSVLVALLVVALWIIYSAKVRTPEHETPPVTTEPLYTDSSTEHHVYWTSQTSDTPIVTNQASVSTTASPVEELSGNLPATTTTDSSERLKKVLFIVADGIPADVIENASVTHMKSIQTIGAYSRAYVGGEKGTYTQTPTISSPGYMSLLTGTWAHKHNIYNNYVKNPNYRYKNIFRLVKEQQPKKTIGIFSTWTTNRIKLIGEGLPDAGNITFDYKFDGYELDRMTYPHDRRSVYIHHIDERVTNETAQCIRTHAPDLSWVYLQFTDDIGHFYGDGERFQQAILYLDDQIGRIWQAIDYRTKYHREEWLLLITTDHGRDSKSGKHHAGQSVRERTTWMITNRPTMNTYFHDLQPGIIDILPTIARFMNLTIPVELARELDGTPLIGKVSLVNPIIHLNGAKLNISWTVLHHVGNVTIWLSTANLFKKGLSDNYTLIDTVPIDQKTLIVDVRKFPSHFYKIVLEGQYNTVNRWVHRLWHPKTTKSSTLFSPPTPTSEHLSSTLVDENATLSLT